MLITKLRVTDYRCIAGSLEFAPGPGLNVLHGPNESGKSTLMEALRNALLVKARSSSEFHKAMAPHGGGQPEVEVAFERGGVGHLLTKRFHASGGTRLVLTRGHASAETLEDDAAEDRLREVLGLADAGRSRDPLSPEHTNFWPLLFVGQNRSDRAPGQDLGETGRGSLSAALGCLSGEALDGGGEGAALAALAEERFLSHFTPGGSVRKSAGTERARVLATLEEAEATLADLRTREAGQAEALAAHHRVSATLAGLAEQLPALEESADRAAKAAREAAVRGARRDEATARRDATALERRQAAERAAEHDRLQDASAEAQAAAEAARAAVPGEAEAPAGPPEAPQEAAAAEAALRAAELHRDTLRLGAEAGAAAERIRAAAAAAEKLAEASRRRVLISVTPAGAQELRGLAEALAVAEAADAATRAAAAPTVEVAVEGERAASVTGEGPEPVDAEVGPGEAASFSASAPLTVDLPGHLRVSVRPADPGADSSDAPRRELAQALEEAGVSSADEAAALAAEARELDARRAHLKETLALHAPEGLEVAEAEAEALEAKRAALGAERDALRGSGAPALPASDAEAAEAVDAARRTRDALRDRVDAARARHDAAERAAADARQARALALQKAERAEADRAAADRTLAAWQTLHGDRDGLAAASRAADEAAGAAEASLAALPEVDVGAAHDDAERAGRALESTRAEARSLRDEASRLDERLHAADALGLPDRLAAAVLEAERARAAAERLDAEAAAAQRLHETLTRHRLAARQRFLQPLRREVDRLLPRLFPGASTRFDADFGGLQVERGGAPEDHADLSAGGREQLGVLVRLAMARVLAGEGDAGAGPAGVLPLLLDDPLTHTDAGRFEAMAAVLHAAAPPLQVILATCHWARHRTLGVDPRRVFDLGQLRRGG